MSETGDEILRSLNRLRSQLRAWPPSATWWGIAFVIALAYYFTAELGLAFAMQGGVVTPVWPPSGIALGMLLVFGRNLWPGVWVGAFAANLVGIFGDPNSGPLAPALLSALGMSSGATLSAWFAAGLIRHLIDNQPPLDRVRDVCLTLAVGGPVACLISATAGAGSLALSGVAPWTAFGQIWFTWWLGDTAGVIVFTPLILAWATQYRFDNRPSAMELVACAGLLSGVTYAVFVAESVLGFEGRSLVFLLLPFLVWPALRFGQRGAATAALVVAGLSVQGTTSGSGPFQLTSLNESLLVLELFLSTVSAIALCVAAVATEQRSAQTSRRRVLEALEELVHERTQELATSEGRLRAIVDAEPECVKIVAPNGELEMMNPAGLRMIEAGSEEQVLGCRVLDLISPPYRNAFAQLHQSVMDGGSGVLEFEITGRRGTRRWMESHAVPLRDAAGEVVGQLAVTRDITSRRKAAERLRESEARFRLLADAAPAHIWMSDPLGRITYVNKVWLQFTGYPAEEDPDKGWFQWMHANDVDHWRKTVAKAVAGGRAFELEYRMRRADGEYRWFLVHGAPRFDDGGGCEGFIGSAFDITDHRAAEEVARQSQKMDSIGQLAGGIAHDFNNIITVIEGNASLLLLDEHCPAPLREGLRDISEAAQRAADLTRQLLTFGRRQLMQPENLDLAAAINGMTRMLTRLLGDDIELRLSTSADPPRVRADSGMIQQVLMNLAVNARNAMPRGGTLSITLDVATQAVAPGHPPDEEAAPHARLVVTDTGCGIPAEHLPRLFEPFFTTREVGEGSGLGLATVYTIIQQHKGWIEVESEIGKGAEFRVYLPIVGGEIETKTSPDTSSSTAHGTETVLVVEDEPTVLKMAAHTLSRFGYQVLQAPSGGAALELLESTTTPIDLLLTDVMMPGGVSGIDLARKLQAADPGLRVILASGYNEQVLGDDFQLGEKTEFLQKPYSAQSVTQAIRALLDRQD